MKNLINILTALNIGIFMAWLISLFKLCESYLVFLNEEIGDKYDLKYVFGFLLISILLIGITSINDWLCKK